MDNSGKAKAHSSSKSSFGRSSTRLSNRLAEKLSKIDIKDNKIEGEVSDNVKDNVNADELSDDESVKAHAKLAAKYANKVIDHSQLEEDDKSGSESESSSSTLDHSMDTESQLNTTTNGTANSSLFGQEMLSLNNESEILRTARNEAVLLNEEFRQWKRNIPYLYNFFYSSVLEWPSMTVEWFPETINPPGKDYTIHRIAVGTHTASGDDNRLLIYRFHLSNYDAKVISDFTKSRPEHGQLTTQLKYGQEFSHEGRVQRARVMPQPKNQLVATIGPTAKVFLYDVSTWGPLQSTKPSGPCKTLEGHSKGGFALAWSRLEEGRLLSGSDDGTVCLWDVKATDGENLLQKHRVHKGRVNDVDCNRRVAGLYVTCGVDKSVVLWDAREGESPFKTLNAHSASVTCVAFQPDSDRVFVSGSVDNVICVWDMRNLNKCGYLKANSHSITSIQWCPQIETVFATTGTEGRVLVWDLALCDREIPLTKIDREQGPDELLFAHGAHLSHVSEMCWSPSVPLMMASVDTNNMMYITRMGQWNVPHHLKKYGNRLIKK